MNTAAKPSRFALALSVLAPLALALSACEAAPEPVIEPPLKGATIGGEFELVNSAGDTVRWSDFDGRYRVVYFGFAFCPDICPTDVQRTVQGLSKFEVANPDAAAGVQAIFISVDPERDSGEVLDEFTSAFSDDLIGLTGTPDQLAETARAFGAFYSFPEERDGDDYLVDHSRTVLLFGPAGKPLATLPADLGADAVARELAKWVTPIG